MSMEATKPETDERTVLKKARVASWGAFSGQAIEYYDFALYATSAAIVFNVVFFPSEDPVVASMLAFATFAVGFIVRPLGGIVFGHLGDKYGRKGSLIATLVIMGISTTLIGLLPTYGQVGMVAPILLVLLRVIQGIALGGEWGGASLVAVEHAPEKKRALYGAIPQLGSPAGTLLSTAMMLLFGLLPDEQFLTWGWRVPFLFSAVLLVIALLIRSKVDETPDFVKNAEKPKAKFPVIEVIRTSPMIVLFGILAVLLSTGGYYLINTFTVSYVVDNLGLDRSVALTTQIVNATVQALVLLLIGLLGTRRSPRIIVTVSALMMAAWAFPLYGLMQTGAPLALYAGLAIATVIGSGIWALLPTLLASQFPAHIRYSGISLVYQGGSSIGGMLPLLATIVLNASGGSPWSLALMLVAVSLLTAIGAFGLKRTWKQSGAAVADAE